MTVELSPEDSFRLNVLLSQDLKAVRLDESAMVLHALTDKGEASIPLTPNCRADRYLRLVRETLSGHALGSPGGYPVYLSRWTRHGQMESANLAQLLLIGEPEAVVAVAHSPALTDELARYAWWTMPTIEHARLMLAREVVARGTMGPVLADFLVEHLPFLQEDHLAIMDTVVVLLHSGVLPADKLEAIWKRGKQQNSYYVAFLETRPVALPVQGASHPALATWASHLATDTTTASRIPWLCPYSGQGQAFMTACAEILARPEIQEVVSRTLNAIGGFFRPVTEVDAALASGLPPDLHALLEVQQRLSRVSGDLANDVFARSSAIGSLMRRKLEPITTPILTDLRELIRAPE